MKLAKALLIAIFVLLQLFPTQTFASFCACCAERGQYTIKVRKPDAYEIGEIKRLKIADTQLYTDNSYPENIKGINPLSDTFAASFLKQNSIWKFSFKNEKNSSATINLANAATIVDFRTDTFNEGEPLLYKEIRFKSKVVSGTGFLGSGITPDTQYFLVLQGKGNNCMNAEDFSHWRLEITGKKANYAFFGKLATIDPPTK